MYSRSYRQIRDCNDVLGWKRAFILPSLSVLDASLLKELGLDHPAITSNPTVLRAASERFWFGYWNFDERTVSDSTAIDCFPPSPAYLSWFDSHVRDVFSRIASECGADAADAVSIWCVNSFVDLERVRLLSMWYEIARPWMMDSYGLPPQLRGFVMPVTDRLLSPKKWDALDELIERVLTFTPDSFETRVLSLEVTQPTDEAFVDVETLAVLVAMRHRIELWLSALREVLDDDFVRELVAWAKKAGDEEGIDPDWIYWPSWLSERA